jgi:YD repeat-containing protein
MVDIPGLLGDARETLFPTRVPQGAGYDLDSMRMARAALLGNLGATLIAAGQGGQSFDQRAAILGRLGQGPAQASEILAQGVRSRYVNEQTRALEQERADRAARDAFFRNSIAGITGGVGVPGGGGLPPVEPPTAAPASPPTAGAATPPAPPPVAAGGDPDAVPPAPTPATVAAAAPPPAPPITPPQQVAQVTRPGGKKAWWEQLGIQPDLAVQIANLPDSQRQQIITKLIADRATPREVWNTVQLKDGRVVQVNSKTNEIRKALDPEAATLGGVPKHIAEQEQALRGEFYKETKDFTDRQTAYMTMRDLAKRGEGVSDQALVLSLMKVYDPTSTVTSTESATAQNAAGVPASMRSLYNNLTGGGKLAPEVRQQLVNAAEQRYAQEYDTFGRRVEHYTTLSKQYGVDPSRVIQDTRDKGYGNIRTVRSATPEQISQMDPATLRSIPRDVYATLSRDQLEAVLARLRAGQPAGGR